MKNGYDEPNLVPAQPSQQLRKNRKRDAEALFLIQSALVNEIFPRIATVATSHEAWEILKNEYLDDKKVVTVKLQTLWREFETLAIKEKEPVQEFLFRVSGIVSHMKTYGVSASNEIIVRF